MDPSGQTPLTDFVAELARLGIQVSAQVYGILAHSKVEADVVQRFFPRAFAEVPVPRGIIDLLIFSGSLIHLYEIKPLGGTVPPERQIDRYLTGARILGLPAVAGTLTFGNTIRGPFLIDKIRYQTDRPGVVIYEPYIDLPDSRNLLPVPIATILAATLLTYALLTTLINTRPPAAALI